MKSNTGPWSKAINAGASRKGGWFGLILVSGELDWQCHWARWTLVFSDDEGSMCDYFPAHDPNSGGRWCRHSRPQCVAIASGALLVAT
jgi:hypothetical protein